MRLGSACQLADPLEQRLAGNLGVRNAETHRSQRSRGVRGDPVASGTRAAFRAEMHQQGVGDAEIALRIFEIDWIDFVRHRR